MPDSIGRANEEERVLGRIPKQIIGQEDTLLEKHQLRKIIQNDSNGNPVYVGFNEQDKSINDSDWTIKKIFYDTDGNVLDVQVLIGKWTERSILSWKPVGGD